MITIRPATREDAATILSFQLSMAEETEAIALDKLIVSKGIAALFDDPGKGIYYVAQAGEKVIGCFLVTYEWSDWRNGVIWWLQSVYVEAGHRRKGMFRKMYDHITRTIDRDPSVVGLRLYVEKNNERAQRVYRSLGMNGDHYTVFEKMKTKQAEG
jgi:ribosomal protein S18 acetylase RimI-like enzyme